MEAAVRLPAIRYLQGIRLDGKHLIFWSLTLVLGIIVLVPLSLLILNSFRQATDGVLDFGLSGLTLRNYIEAYSHPATFHMLLNSFVFAVGSMLVAIFFGGSLAFLSERTDLRFREYIPLMVMIPLIMPSVVKGIAWIYLLSPRIGLLNVFWQGLGFDSPLLSAYSLPAMIWVEGISMSTLAFL